MLPLRFILFAQIASRAMASFKGSYQESDNIKQYHHRTIAGVQVIDTPLVRAAQQLALKHSTDWAYKHIMRSWLFGTLIIDHNATLRESADLEVHAIAALMHDIGWDPTPNSPFVSSDKRFEVDGAIAARELIRSSNVSTQWDDHRVQLVWDAIALHATPSIHAYKELEVAITATGISADAVGPILGITKDQYDAVVKEFPNFDLVDGANKTMIWLCRTKPRTTIDTWVQPWGEYFVPNYTTKGFRTIDQALGGNVPDA
ncbi:unnamed protein product [Clonostachys rhizophaga]|uniref:HD domain-containing protein n=1 Tax=Clonostachys rhizophaga TaxID=160324 RepID=A0A9N9VQZ1_9HYPO|nr:unnamed protein product [Clonostachys rhizophaga]